jgi:hypothetical protein
MRAHFRIPLEGIVRSAFFCQFDLDVTADRAYVVVPADYTYKQKGKAMKQTGSILTVALQKGSAGWRITGWAWSRN